MPDEINTDENTDLPILLDDGASDQEAEGNETEADDDAEPTLAEILGGEDITDADLALLTEAERRALLDEDDDEGEEQGEGQGDAAADPADAAAPQDAGQAADPQDTAPAPDNAAPEEAVAPEDNGAALKEALDAISAEAKAEMKAAFARYDDGDLTASEYQDKLAEITEATQAKVAAARDEIEYEQVKSAFLTEAKTYLGEHPGLLDPAHVESYDRHVRHVTSAPAFAGMSHRHKLEAAHRLYEAEAQILNVAGVPPAPVAKAASQPAKPQPAKQAETQKPADKPEDKKAAAPKPAPKPAVVPTLARVPAAATTELSGSRWAALQERFDAADTAGRERIMASLSDREREEFASADLG